MFDLVLLAQQATQAAPDTSVAAIVQILSNVGLGGAAIYAVIKLWHKGQKDQERYEKRLDAAQTKHDALQKKFTETVERLEKEKHDAVEKVQKKVDEIQGNQYKLMVELVPKLECLDDRLREED